MTGVPFKEAEEIRFNYSNYYRMLVPGESPDRPYLHLERERI